MKIAIISDIHGNLEALKYTLEDIKSRSVDKIYCLGDIIAKGTHQQECLDLVRQYCEVIIKGNCDEYFTSDIDISTKSSEEVRRILWNHKKINEESKAFLRTLPFCHEFYLSGRLIRLIHAHPESISKFIGNIDYLGKLYELLLPSENTVSNEKADVVIYGHIHTPFIQKIYNRFIINPGSLGNTIDVFRNKEKDGDILNTTTANYLILEGNLESKNMEDPISFDLVSVAYDIDKELDSNKDNIEFDSYATELKNGQYRDMEKIYRSFEARGIKKEDI
jgi:protein phosphatase